MPEVSSLPARATTPVHAQLSVVAGEDEQGAKQWRWTCACGETGPWAADHVEALAGAREHREQLR